MLALIAVSFTGQAQVKTVAAYLGSAAKRADHLYEHYYYQEAIELYRQALEKKPDNDRLKLQIAESYRKLNNPEQAAIWYKKVINHSDIVKPKHKLYYAQALLSNQQYWQAEEWYIRYQQEARNGIATNRLQGLAQMPAFYRDSAMYTLKELNTNSPASDFSPAFYDSGMVFVSARNTLQPIKQLYRWNETPYLDLFYTDIAGKKAPRLFNSKLNTIYHEGPAVFYSDDTKVIFTRNSKKRDESKVSKLALFEAERSPEGSAWSTPVPLAINNPNYSVGHPAITQDGNTLYFISDMPGGLGGTDIYVSQRKNGEWQAPANLGSSVNTPGDEMFLFLHNDETLYFASDGRGGLGGLDTYRVSIGVEGAGFPENVGYPINTSYDDFGFILNQEGDLGYLSSNRQGEAIDDDIYQFTVRRQFLDVVVYDEQTKQRIQDAEVTLIGDGMIKDLVNTNQEGVVRLKVNPYESYIVNVDKRDYSGNAAIIDPESMLKSTDVHETKMPLTQENGSMDLLVTLFDSYTDKVIPYTLVNVVNVTTGDTLSRVTNDQGEVALKVSNQSEYKFHGLIGKTEWDYGTVKTTSLKPDEENNIRIPVGTDRATIPLRVVVRDAQDQSLLEHVTVRLVEKQQQKATLRTATDGIADLKVDPQSNYSLSIQSVTYHDTLVTITSEQLLSDTAYVEVLLNKTEETVNAVVHLHDAETDDPVINTLVRVKREDTGEEIVTMSDDKGNVRLKLKEGVPYQVSGEIDGEAWRHKEAITVSSVEGSERNHIRVPVQRVAADGPVANELPAVSATLVTVKNRQKGDQTWVYIDQKLYELKQEEDQPYLEGGDEKIELYAMKDSSDHSDPVERLLSQINAALDNEMTIQNIYFDFDKYNITSEAARELKKIISLMKQQPSLALEVSAHTDNRGSQSYNLLLSKLRAKSVVHYLIKQKIAEDRIKMLYYGEKQPLQPCDTSNQCDEDAHRVNRRAEFEFNLIK